MEKNQSKEQCKIYNENHMENCNVFMGDVYGATFPLPGAEVTIEQHFDKGQKPKQEVKEGRKETDDEHKKRKAEVTKVLVDKLSFESVNLGQTNQGRVTNEDLGYLLRRILGMTDFTTSQENRERMETLWELLIDKRYHVGGKGIGKHAGEDYFRQTFLNIVGRFMQKGLICGTKDTVCRALFNETDNSMAKNLERALDATCFTEAGINVMVDEYIDKLLNGKL